MTGHGCPECGVHRPGCACARTAETAAAGDFDPLRIRPYVTLDAAEGPAGPYEAGAGPEPGHGAGGDTDGPYAGGGASTAHPVGMTGSGGSEGAFGPEGNPAVGWQQPASSSAHPTGDAPTTQLAAVRPTDAPTTQLAAVRPTDAPVAPLPAEVPIGGQHAPYRTDPEAYPTAPSPGPHPGAVGPAPHPDAGDASETMPLLLRGLGEVPPGPRGGRARGRKRGAAVASVAAVAVAGTAVLAAAVLGGAKETEDRAAVPEVTTSASLNVAVSEAPSPSSETPEPTASSPSPDETSASPSPTSSPSPTTASPSASATSAAPPTAAPSTATTTAPSTPPPSSQPPQPTEEASVTLSIGSSGEEVLELQARLTLVGAYRGAVDGRYDQEVWRAVKTYQSWMYIEDDPRGVYGPHTRKALERSTWL
ncbi:peptidoglycan-binding protein [Streptomyces sp. NPDC058877]|uniref:peptidoglycan-binding domain-containing protein n=1 Tax=Streptomyces sp. NPDC058877 TaxID=3346665 RepID=UPI00369FDFAB